MDKDGKEQDNRNIGGSVTNVPVYALYGEKTEDPAQDWLHWETIAHRASLHDFHILPHRHEHFFQILKLDHGQADLSLDGHIEHVRSPAIIAIPAIAVHGYAFSSDVDGAVITLFERDVRNAVSGAPELDALLRSPLIITSPAALEFLNAAIAAMLAEADAPALGRAIALPARITDTLVALARAQVGAADLRTPSRRAEQQVRAFQHLVEKDYRDHLPLKHFASALGITPTHLNRLCRTVLQMSARAVIERRIVFEARRYLTFSTLSVKSIALSLGYADPAYFSRAFRRASGMTPLEFRNHGRKTKRQINAGSRP